MKATKAQIKKIHVLRDILGLDNDDYRTLLQQYVSDNQMPTSALLTKIHASELIEQMEHNVEHRQDLKGEWRASEKQQQMLLAIWHEISYHSSVEIRSRELDSFIRKHFHVAGLSSLPRKRVGKVKAALEAIRKQRSPIVS